MNCKQASLLFDVVLVEYEKGRCDVDVASHTMVVNGKLINMTKVILDDFSLLYESISTKKAAFPVKILRRFEAHEKGENALQPKTYDLIRGSINNWDLAAGDKIKALFHMYEEILIQPACFIGSVKAFKDSIDKIV